MAPIKRSIYLQPLSREHHFSLLFGWKLRQGIKRNIPVERILPYVLYFEKSMLITHFKEEEDCLFIFDEGLLVKQAITEHKEILQIIDQFKQAPLNTQYEQLNALADKIDSHVRLEERELFPYLESKLSQEQLQSVLKCTKNGPAAFDDFEDEFWNENKDKK